MTFSKTRWALAAAASAMTLASGAAQASSASSMTPPPEMPGALTEIVDSATYAPSKNYNFPTEAQYQDMPGTTSGSGHTAISDQPGGSAQGWATVDTGAQTVYGKAYTMRGGDNKEVYIAGGSATLSYFVTVTGPTSGAQDLVVPLHLLGAYYVRASGSSQDGQASGSISYSLTGFYSDVTGGTTLLLDSCNATETCHMGSFFTDFTLAAYANGQSGNYAEVNIGASALSFAEDNSHIYDHEGGEFIGDAFIDPKITIDADWLAANPGFQVNFSENVANGAGVIGGGSGGAGGVPEPASWALMIAGFGLAGAALRRRRGAFAA